MKLFGFIAKYEATETPAGTSIAQELKMAHPEQNKPLPMGSF